MVISDCFSQYGSPPKGLEPLAQIVSYVTCLVVKYCDCVLHPPEITSYLHWHPQGDSALPSPAPKLSVLIVNFNGGAYVQGALDSLKRQTRRDFEVILVDNDSTDGSVDNLDTRGLPTFTLMRETENHGFARGNNLAAAQARGRWLALLNPDAAAAPDWLDQIEAGAARHRDVTSFACTQISMHAPSRLDGTGDNYLLWGFPWRGGYGRPASERPDEGECFSPCGASAVYRRDVFLAHGGFDERLFCFCEDVDLGFRLRLQGERCIFLPDAVVHHVGGGLSDKVSGFAVRYGTRNRLWVYVKNMPLLALLLGAPIHAAMTAAILMRGLFTGRFSDTWRGLVEGIVGIGPMIEDRQQLQRMRTVRTVDLLSRMAWNPFALLGSKPHIMPIKYLTAARAQLRKLQ
jgi:N-acetylglucosaminyl-diphospho-decaprenol L-rhamnosyltransferase